MPDFLPFKGIIPAKNLVDSVPVLPYETYSEQEIEEIIKEERNSFLQVIKPVRENHLAVEERYSKIRHNFENFIETNRLSIDCKPCYYVYQQQYAHYTIEGIVGLIDVEEYKQGKIRRHEKTLTERKKVFAHYLNIAAINAEPVLLTYARSETISAQLVNIKDQTPYCCFEKSGVKHRLWKVCEASEIALIQKELKAHHVFYIADGHHRIGSSEMNADWLNQEGKQAGNHNYILSYLVDDHQLKIFDFNRLIKDLNKLSKETLLAKISEFCEVQNHGSELYYPSHKHHIGMYLAGEFYSLYIKHQFRGTPQGLGELDTYLFEETILKPIFDIQDTRTDKRIGFIAGDGSINGSQRVKEEIDAGRYSVGFIFYPVSVDDLTLIADLDLTMPPKSTYILPKMLNGLLIHDLKAS